MRRSLTEAEVASSSASIHDRLLHSDLLVGARVLLVYVSVGKEVETRSLIQRFFQLKKRIVVPSVVGATRMEACEIAPQSEWRIGRFGVPVPESSLAFAGSLDICIVPGLAFSRQGDRLGFGRGHWDRFFERTPVGKIVGLCHDCQLVEHLPVESTDRPADVVITGAHVLYRNG